MTAATARGNVGRWLPALVPVALAVLFALVGRSQQALVFAAVAVGVGGLVALGVPVARFVDVAVRRFGQVLWAVAAGAGLVIAIVVTWPFRVIFRHGPLHGGPDGWQAVAPERAGQPQLLGTAGANGGRPVGARLFAGIGLIMVLFATDYGVGRVWDHVFQPDVAPVVVPVKVRDAGTGTPSGELDPDPRAASPAFVSSPWAPTYLRELQRQPFGYWPYTADRPLDYRTKFVNIEDWARKTWTDGGSGSKGPVIWFFGGSAMFGEGQRDDHTIASELSRLAAADGHPIRPVNYGQRGWVHFQESLLYEQQLALKPDPDLAVFYDGPNDLQAASVFDAAIPADLHADQYAQALRYQRLTTTFVLPPPRAKAWPAVVAEYRRHSAVLKLAHWVGLAAEPAGASPSRTPNAGKTRDDGSPTGEVTATRGPGGNLVWGSKEDGVQGLQLYNRARRITGFLSRSHQVEPVFVWQPVGTGQDAVRYAREHLDDDVIDLSDVFDGVDDPLYIDTTHTNEQGARLVAEALWKELRPKVRAWYRTHG